MFHWPPSASANVVTECMVGRPVGSLFENKSDPYLLGRTSAAAVPFGRATVKSIRFPPGALGMLDSKQPMQASHHLALAAR